MDGSTDYPDSAAAEARAPAMGLVGELRREKDRPKRNMLEPEKLQQVARLLDAYDDVIDGIGALLEAEPVEQPRGERSVELEKIHRELEGHYARLQALWS